LPDFELPDFELPQAELPKLAGLDWLQLARHQIAVEQLRFELESHRQRMETVPALIGPGLYPQEEC
jgi:hypothetical protein